MRLNWLAMHFDAWKLDCDNGWFKGQCAFLIKT